MASERVLTLVCTVITVIDNDLDKIHVHYTKFINTAAITTKAFEIWTFISFYSTEITYLFVNKKCTVESQLKLPKSTVWKKYKKSKIQTTSNVQVDLHWQLQGKI